MDWVASTFHTTSEHGVSNITTADAHTSAASSRLNWLPGRFKWTSPFRRKTKSGFCVCTITFQLASTTVCIQQLLSWMDRKNPTRATDSHLERIIRTNCCIHTVAPPVDGPRYARNMYCTGWRNILRISCASSWFFFTQLLLWALITQRHIIAFVYYFFIAHIIAYWLTIQLMVYAYYILLFKFSVIFIHVELKGNCGEDVCFNNVRSAVELGNLKKNL